MMQNEKKLSIGILILISIVSGILNFLLTVLFEGVLHLPLFLDTILVMAVLFSHGLFPSLGTFIVHYVIVFTRLFINHDPVWGCFYAIPGFFIVIITWLFIRHEDKLQKNVNFTFIFILLASLCAAMASCISAGLVNYLIDKYVNFNEGWEPILDSIQETQSSNLLSLIIGRIPLTSLDRIITTFLGFGIYKLIFFISQKIKRS